jgi:hypothetical protein
MSPAPTADLVTYLNGLRSGKYSFDWNLNGHQAASQLGFENRFSANYGQMAEQAQLRLSQNGSVNVQEMIAYLNGIVGEEEAIDALSAKRERHFSSIAYLRALQEGQCNFPYVLKDTPDARTVLAEVRRAYPALNLERASATFSEVYNEAIDASRRRIEQTGSVSIFRSIEDLRHAILEGQEPAPTTLVSQSSDGWYALSVAPAGTYGWSNEHSTQAEAQEEALRNCVSATTDPRTCKTVVVEKGSCVAVAQCNVSGQQTIWFALADHIKDALDGSFRQAAAAGISEQSCKTLTSWCPQ